VGAQQSTQSPPSPGAVTVSGPVALTSGVRDAAHGYPFNASTLDLQKQGYVEEEFFIRGAARSYDIPRDQMSNGTAGAAIHAYRLVVPGQPSQENSTAPPSEWSNVSGDSQRGGLVPPPSRERRGTRGSACRRRAVGVSAMKQWSQAAGRADVTDGGTGGRRIVCEIFTACGAGRPRTPAQDKRATKVQR
jgi:hypothetical protein